MERFVEFVKGFKDYSGFADVTLAIIALAAFVISVTEYYKSKRDRKTELALQALQNWDDKLDKMTGVGISLLRDSDKIPELAEC